jgi:hypothetical protein
VSWSAEDTERLRALWTAGHTAQQIADALNISRSAVCAKAQRLGLALADKGHRACDVAAT